jgi:hypothetical protein
VLDEFGRGEAARVGGKETGQHPGHHLGQALRIRKLFRRMSWLLPLLRPTGLTPRMTAEQIANSNIEVGVIARERELGPVLDNITSRRGTWLLRGPRSEAAMMSKNGSAPASIR